MSDENAKNNTKAVNNKISTLVWKLSSEIEGGVKRNVPFYDVPAVKGHAIEIFKDFLDFGVVDINDDLHLNTPKHRSPRTHSASSNRRHNVHTTPGSEFLDDVKLTLNFEDDQTHHCIERNQRKLRELEEKHEETNLENLRLGQELDRVNKYIAELEYHNEYLMCQVDLAVKEKSEASRNDCFERNPMKLREFEEKYKETSLENIRLGKELDRVNTCIAKLEYQNENLTCQVDLAEKAKSNASRKEEMKYKHLESDINRYKAEINDLVHRDSNNNHRVHANRYRSERDLARCENKELKTELEKLRRTEAELKSVKDENTALRHANENKTKMIEEIQNRADEEIKDANDAIVYYKEEEQRYKKAQDDNNAQIIKLRTEKEDANRRLANLTSERDDANRRLAKLKTERDQSNSDAARLKVEKDELLNLLQKQKSSNDAGRHCEDALNNQLHEKDLECKQSKKIVENLNRKLDEIQSQQKEFLKPRDREDLKREKNSNRKLIEENEELRNTVFEIKQKLSVAAEKHMEEQTPFLGNLCDINRPTVLADKFSSLYTDEYTDAMAVIERSMDEAGAVKVMLEWLKSCNDWCERLAREQIDLLTTESIGFMNKYHGEKIDFVIPDNCHILVKELQRQIADSALAAVRKICHVKSVKQENLIHNSYIVKYIQRCSELCWRMQITNPPMCLKFDVKNGENLDKTLYTAFTKNGSRIEYLVWPILFLHKTGPLMTKGVAQGT